MLPAIDLNLLRIFDAVMTERNVTRAALVLHMTQPAVSNAINRLRLTLKDPLFIKIQGGVLPTQRAELLWPPIRDALARIHETLATNEFDPARSEAVFRLAMSDYVADQVIRPLFVEQQAVAPNVRIHLHPYSLDNAAVLLEKGEVEMAAGVYSNVASSLRMLPLETLTYVCAMRKGHPLLAQARLRLEDFLRARHLMVSLLGTPSLIDHELAAHGLKRNVVLTINQFALAPRLLAETDLICVVPVNTVRNSPHSHQLEAIEAPFPFVPRTVNLIWHERSDNEPAHRWLREEILKVCQAQGMIFDQAPRAESHAY
ncbi:MULTISPECIES: LysR family transcriptional regulator [unclassified Achromobacter]|uniref:LysR family transcriptional regulator n=1 Tax=unclassified Achromobacter TaxID=2626865 RepID=UPI000B51AC43|nr:MULTISPECIES: LysR family transcriptional regulator [unclassified Achromobacter]OWT80274.1 LysR family transcriptional regulator [Achromobacter sp. HZ34]OWT82157.1 LysR family transcriptional regulator [Achromobacter sp. HZ28]